jgi:hypothetical protein
MKNVICAIICFLIAILISCNGREYYKYKKGDIVYLKPDSTKGVISEVNNSNDDYKVVTGYESGFFTNNIQYVSQEEIY